MATLETISRELMGLIPNLDVNAAEAYANRAWVEICRQYEWSWLRKEVHIIIPAVISSGAVSVVFGSDEVTFNVTAKTALASAGLPLVTERCLKLAGYLPIRLTEYDPGTGVGKLELPCPASDNAAAAYQLTRPYFAAPENFKAWETFRWQTEWRRIQGLCQKADLDMYDPTRQSQGVVTHIATHTAVADGRIFFEMWPTPVSRNILRASYLMDVFPLELTTTLPRTMDGDVVLEAAKCHAYEWAQANAPRFPATRMVAWRDLRQVAELKANEKIGSARRKDLELYPEQRDVSAHTAQMQTYYPATNIVPLRYL